MNAKEILAFDRASVRSVDEDGRLHVAITNISKANVCPYYGHEIPDAERLGLNPDKVYMLLRDPDELEKAASTFNNIPLLSKHVPFSVDEHDKELIVGATGSQGQFKAPYLKNSLVVWDSVAIAGIDKEVQRELSSSYRYDVDMTPGVFEGTPYDGVMRNIRGNHVALVEVGRAGPDVVVGDSNLFNQTMEYQTMKASRKSIAVKAALGVYLRPLLAQDAAIGDLGALVRGVKAATIAQDKTRIAQAVQAAAKDKLAQDVELNTEELAEIIEAAAEAEPEEVAEDEDEQREDESDEDYKARMEAKKAAQDEDGDDKKADDEDDDEDDKSKAAMDAAIASAVKATEKATIKRMNSIRQAEKEVQPLIGEVVAQDSAEAVYKLALDHAGVDTQGVHPSAYGAMVRMLGKAKAEPRARVAMDSSTNEGFAKRFPTAGKLLRS